MLGEELRKAREDAGLSRAKLAEATGLSTMGVWKLEQGEDARLASLRKLAKALRLTITVTPQGRVTILKEAR